MNNFLYPLFAILLCISFSIFLTYKFPILRLIIGISIGITAIYPLLQYLWSYSNIFFLILFFLLFFLMYKFPILNLIIGILLGVIGIYMIAKAALRPYPDGIFGVFGLFFVLSSFLLIYYNYGT